jgi:transcriptional regulator with XRE-family HTH domain
MSTPTPGADQLRAYCDGERGRQYALATRLNVSQAAVSAWAAGKARPEPAYREALSIALNIPVDAWVNDEDRAIVERARAATTATPTAEGA